MTGVQTCALPISTHDLLAAGLPAEVLRGTDFFAAAARGATVFGECGGYMAMGELLTDADGRTHAMAALLPLATSFAERRLHLGYRQVAVKADCAIGAAGRSFRGHEFHYATVQREEGDTLFEAANARGESVGPMGLRRGRVLGSFCHLIDSV